MSVSVMNQLIDRFSGSPKKRNGIQHQALWLRYFETGTLPFTSIQLHDAMLEIISKPENLPKGNKLLHRQRKDEFTLKKKQKTVSP